MSKLPSFVSLKNAGPMPALVLNADYRPLSLFPLSIWTWHDAVRKLVSDRVTVVAEHDAAIRWPSGEMRAPSVVALKDYVKHRAQPAFTRANIILRDRSSCGYCAEKLHPKDVTLDHIHPKSRGGRSCWENMICSCGSCNFTKADRTPAEAGMQLQWRPWRPTAEELFAAQRHYPPGMIPEIWESFLTAA